MRDIWEVLGIEKTTNTREIKKAYAGLVKHCHQEDEPEKWQELHCAYEHAMTYAKRMEGVPYRKTEPSYTSHAEPVKEKKTVIMESREDFFETVYENSERQEKVEEGQDYTELFEQIVTKQQNKENERARIIKKFHKIAGVECEEQVRAWKVFFEKKKENQSLSDELFWKLFLQFLKERGLEQKVYVTFAEIFDGLLEDEDWKAEENIKELVRICAKHCHMRGEGGAEKKKNPEQDEKKRIPLRENKRFIGTVYFVLICCLIVIGILYLISMKEVF